jgi:serine/threonine protein kinase
MALRTGDRLGAYEIVGLLGHGAMGEVYRARDTRLGRDVAIKVLPAAFANDPDRLARLEREARLISQVNHPNICTLFDIVEGQNAPFLILEFIEGETLQQRLLRGPMPLREALRCASGIAAALEAAHSKGIIHRDLKPSNIKITAAGAIKVLDFGVAKIARDSGSEFGAPDLTLTLGGTKEGVLVGTVAYVSPEQAMGDRVDGRSDIWAFGCLLYEMLTAKRAFPGVAVADTLGAVMRGEPDWTALPGDTPPELRTLLRRCLEKDRGRRLADIADARLEIDDLLAGRSEPAPKFAGSTNKTVAPSKPRRGRLIVALAFLAGVIFASVIARLSFNRQAESKPPVVDTSPPVSARAAESRGNTPAAPQEVESPPPSSSAVTSRASTAADAGRNRSPDSAPAAPSRPVPAFVNLPEGVMWAPAVDSGVPNTILALSPDGRLVVYSGRAGGVTALWLRSFMFDDAWQLPGTEGGISPFWSPDSASIGFFADRKLKRLDLNGLGTRSRDARGLAVPATLCEVQHQRGGTWGPDDTIVFAPFPGGLKRISANGGAVTSLTHLEPGEPHHVRPHFLAGTRRLLYRVSSGNGRNNSYYVTSLDASERKLIATLDAGNVTYSQGQLLFMQNHTLMAEPFDLKTLAIPGPPRPIANGVLLSTGSPPVFGVFSASQTGRLVYLSQGRNSNDPMTVLSNWADSPAAR